MDEVTQQNVALVEEAAAAAQSLRDQAERLSQSIGVFKLEQSDGLALNTAPASAKRTIDITPRTAQLPRRDIRSVAQKQLAAATSEVSGSWEQF